MAPNKGRKSRSACFGSRFQAESSPLFRLDWFCFFLPPSWHNSWIACLRNRSRQARRSVELVHGSGSFKKNSNPTLQADVSGARGAGRDILHLAAVKGRGVGVHGTAFVCVATNPARLTSLGRPAWERMRLLYCNRTVLFTFLSLVVPPGKVWPGSPVYDRPVVTCSRLAWCRLSRWPR